MENLTSKTLTLKNISNLLLKLEYLRTTPFDINVRGALNPCCLDCETKVNHTARIKFGLNDSVYKSLWKESVKKFKFKILCL